MGAIGISGRKDIARDIAAILKAKTGESPGGVAEIVFKPRLFAKPEIIVEIIGRGQITEKEGIKDPDLLLVFKDKSVLTNKTLMNYLEAKRKEYAARRDYGPNGITLTIQ